MADAEALRRAQQAAILRGAGKLQEALAEYQQTLKLQPDFALAHCGIAEISETLGNSAEAIFHYEKAIALQPDLILAQNNLGVLYQAEGRADDAIRCYQRVLAIAPGDAKMLHNLGDAWFDKGDLARAADFYDRALAIDPSLGNPKYSKAVLQLLQGDFAAGWQGYEARFNSDAITTPMRNYSAPLWNGEKTNSKILLWGEQGIGDEIMFAGLIPDAQRTGNEFILDCANARLKPLFQRSFPQVTVIAGETPGDIATHLPLGSLPHLFRNSEKDFAGTTSPYLIAAENLIAEFRARYGANKKRIGIAWHSAAKKTGRQRSVPLAAFAPLFQKWPNAHWISLQYGDATALETEATHANAPLTIDRSIDQLRDMDRFAAQIAALDLVITVDSAAAHLAGALGIPAMVLLPKIPDWRWQLGRADNLWYPKMRLFRQKIAGDWHGAINEILMHPAV